VQKLKLLIISSLIVILITSLLAGCNGDSAATPTSTATSPPGGEVEWQWPERIHISAAGNSGMVKYVSYLNLMESDVPAKIRIIPESSGVLRDAQVAQGKVFWTDAGKSSMKNCIEALEEYALKDAGPYNVRIVWVHSLANSGVFVRGDSKIQTIYDIKPGTRWAVWATLESVMRVPKAILDWIQVDHDDIQWVNAGSTEGTVRAVQEGRADVTWFFPTSSMVYEASSAPEGIRFLDLNSSLDPEGAERFRQTGAMYTFAPMETGVPQAIGVWGTYGYKWDVTRAESDEELVYQFAKWLDENYDRYVGAHQSNIHMSLNDMMISLDTTYIPCHDGLIRYLKEKGLWTEAHERRQVHNIALIDAYVNAYQEAIAIAESKGMAISPVNKDWVQLWEDYKVDNDIPKITMHQSLSIDAEWVKTLGFDD
jgi:TRAP transporter TAXI family solute receptor